MASRIVSNAGVATAFAVKQMCNAISLRWYGPSTSSHTALFFGVAILILLALSISTASARADCIDNAAARAGQDSLLVRAIAWQESGMRADVVRRNRNGTEDIGLMQINSAWLPELARWGIGREQLLDACINAYVGSWILARNVVAHGHNWRAVGAYNAVSPHKQLRYANQVYERWLRLQRNASPTPLVP